MLTELLTPAYISLNLEVKSKKRALEELAQLLIQDASPLTKTDALTSLVNRERLGCTSLGQGIAIPHGRVVGLNKIRVAFVRLSQPVDYDANDGEPVDLLFGILVPQECTQEHLGILARIAELATDEAFCVKLRAAGDADAVLSLLAA